MVPRTEFVNVALSHVTCLELNRDAFKTRTDHTHSPPLLLPPLPLDVTVATVTSTLQAQDLGVLEDGVYIYYFWIDFDSDVYLCA